MNPRNGDFPSTDFINKFSLSYMEWPMLIKITEKIMKMLSVTILLDYTIELSNKNLVSVSVKA